MAGLGANGSDSTPRPREPQLCRHFSQTGSCRAGKGCAFLHDDSRLSGTPVVGRVAEGEMSNPLVVDGMIQDRRQAVQQPSRATVARPVTDAQTQNPRDFQLGQIRRRFSPKESMQGQASALKFNFTPSDPDFPFEMAALECLLSVPSNYPQGRPTLKVGNSDIPRGFALNVEKGFNELAEAKISSTLLELMKLLDRDLESLLSAPKAETVKLVLNKDTRHLSNLPSRPIAASSKTIQTAPPATDIGIKTSQPVYQSFTAQEIGVAAKRREQETRQLEARMGRLPLFKKSSDGIAFTLPIEPRRRLELPLALQSIKLVELFVPMLYPLQSVRVKLNSIDPVVSKPVERGFEIRAAEQRESTLMVHVNYLAQNMHILANTVLEPEKKPIVAPVELPQDDSVTPSSKGKAAEGIQDPDRSHIQYISRPMEWTIVHQDDDSDLDSDDLYSYDSEDDSDEDGGVKVEHDNIGQSSQVATPLQEKGTAITFPFIELYGIELLEIATLNITVKCERCKYTTEVKGLKSEVPKSENCKKCATILTINFRKDLVHANAVRAGFLDLEGCVVGDMLPSVFLPTCSQCSTTYPRPGITSVQGETTHNICHECHQKFSFKIPQVKFLRISSSHLPPAAGPRRKREVLGIVVGTELPRKGRCRHYTKSYRWFRFSCCSKVYACDKCHDDAEEHPNEWANRMICGHCSREGNYRPEDCGFCHGILVGKKGGGGFWEGGKGTRDRVKMSRKDKRKHRRPGGAAKAT